MKLTMMTAAIIAALSTAAMADAPAGASAANCDITQFTPVLGDDGVTVLYWNNPTCKHPSPNESERPANVAADDLINS